MNKKKKWDDHEPEKLLNKVISQIDAFLVGQPNSAVHAVAHICENMSANNPYSEMEHRTDLEATCGAKKATTSKRTKDDSEDEEEEAASAEVAPTAATNDDESTDSKDQDYEEAANNDGDASKAQQANSENDDTPLGGTRSQQHKGAGNHGQREHGGYHNDCRPERGCRAPSYHDDNLYTRL
ncbi:hypothetical protein MTO96_006525 [Rhipicephalus appendiculatus]